MSGSELPSTSSTYANEACPSTSDTDFSCDDNDIDTDEHQIRSSRACRAQKKEDLHSGSGKTASVACTHKEGEFCCAHKLTDNDIRFTFGTMYQDSVKERQDAFVVSLMTINNTARSRLRQEEGQSRSMAIEYYLPSKDSTTGDFKNVRVCRSTFLSVLCIGRKRTQNLATYMRQTRCSRPETRGGPTKHKPLNMMLIEDHIASFKCKESHYARTDAPNRKYLPSTLTVTKMHQLFCESHPHVSVSYNAYYKVFKSNFNIGFGQPRTDVCSTCFKFDQVINSPTESANARASASEQKQAHVMIADRFYQALNEPQPEGTVTVCFDLMQTQELPKSPVGEAYYVRQMWQYFLAFVRHHGEHSPQTTNDIYFYTWGENQAGRGPNEIGSALLHYLRHMLPDGTKHLRLFSDSCPGQNKNYSNMGMLSAYVAETNVRVSYFFPVRGHSYLPADRVFGRVEQKLRHTETILLPDEYIRIFEQFGNVMLYLRDWERFDLKQFSKACMKNVQTFKISKIYRITIEKDLFAVSDSLDPDATFTVHSLLKRGRKFLPFQPTCLQPINMISKEKKMDVMRLLGIMGVSLHHPAYQFYTKICGHTSPPPSPSSNSTDSDGE